MNQNPASNPEQDRLDQQYTAKKNWLKWGPYLTDRQWGTVREDYSATGDAWNHITHDLSRSKAYRWGEEGIGGFSDDQQVLCIGLALWNGKDNILKERLFGLTNSEGNHGED
ncbi:MAG: glucosidase, partial [Pedobacter sp.]|nr:glucosidase [Pedobacter sp.]